MNKIVKNCLVGAGIFAVFALIIGGIVASTTMKPPVEKEATWDDRMTIGNPKAENHFVVYSDLVCPYCIAFENAIVENEEDFQKYLSDNDILLEVRLADFLYEYGEARAVNSRYSAEAAYCARDEDKFWDFYNLAVATVWRDYFKSGGKSGVSDMASLTPDYWIKIGKSVGLGAKFEKCVQNEEKLSEIKETASRMADEIHGMPYFKFNSFTFDGYSLDWGYDYVKNLMDQGLEKK